LRQARGALRRWLVPLVLLTVAILAALPASSEAYTTRGEIKVAAVLVEFTDVKHAASDSDLNALFSRLNSYLEEASFGATRLIIHSFGWFVLPNTMEYYGRGRVNFDALIQDAIKASDPHVNYTLYDILLVVHAGPDEAITHNEVDIWSSACVGPVEVLTDEGSLRLGVATVSEADPVGVYVHELGHCLGLPDLYGAEREYVGPWDPMAAGCWNGVPMGSSPAHFTAWSKIKLGWLTSSRVLVVEPGGRAEAWIDPLEALSNGYQALKVPLGPTSYYMVEVRAKLGFDSALPGEGVLVTLCDDSLSEGVVRVVDANPSTPSLGDAAFNLGPGGVSAFSDPLHRLSIRLLDRRDGSYLVKAAWWLPDLTFRRCWVEPEEVLEGFITLLKAEVVNEGEEDAPPFRVDVYVDGSLHSSLDVEGLRAGESKVLSVAWIATPGLHEVRWVADARNAVLEGDEGDNEASVGLEVKVRLVVRVPMKGVGVEVDGELHRANASGCVELHLSAGGHVVAVEPVYAYMERSRLVFRSWSDGVAENPRPVSLERSLTLEALYARQHLVEVDSPYGSPSGGGWVFEGSRVTVSVTSPFSHGNGTRRVFTAWVGDVASPSPSVEVLVDGPKTLRALWRTEHLCSFTFTDAEASRKIPPPTYVMLKGVDANLTLTEFIGVWMPSGTWTLMEVRWRGCDVKPGPLELKVDSPSSFNVACLVYDLRVEAFDLLGLPIDGAEVRATVANGSTLTARIDHGVAVFSLVPGGPYKVELSYLWQRLDAHGHTSTSTRVRLKVAASMAVIASASAAILAVGGTALGLRRARRRAKSQLTASK
jgi:M6 family metalloprotease-like protein